jgi:hypothetical protein
VGTNPTFRLVFVLMVLAVVVLAQEVPPPDKPPAEKPLTRQVGGLRFLDVTEVTIVNVEVTVTDKKGPVFGLKSGDFEVFQDGKPQDLTNFALFTRVAPSVPAPAATSVPTAAPTIPTPEPTPAPKHEPRFVAFYVDNEYVMPMNRNRVINKMADWV